MTTSASRRRTRSRRLPASAALASGLVALTVFAPLAATAEPVDDTTPPVSTVHRGTPPASGWYTAASVPVRITASDDASGVASISYTLGDAAPVVVAGADTSIVIVDEGVTLLTVWATDAAGNVEDPSTSEFRLDRTPPAIEITTPMLVERGSAVAFEYTCRDAVSGVASCDAALASGSLLPTDVLGEHTVDVTATDVAGFTTTSTFRYLVAPDLTAPTVSIAIAPEPASGWYTTPLGIGIVASDASGIASRHWWTDGAVSMNGDVTGEVDDAVFTLDFDGVTDVSFWAYDSYGNRADGSRRVRVDTVAPTVVASGVPTSLAVPSYRQGERATIGAACADATSGVVACGILEAPTGEVPTSALGEQHLTLFAVDAAGHRTEADFAYRVVAAPVGGGSGGGTGDGAVSPRPAAGDRPGSLASTGVDLAGGVMLASLVLGAGLGLLALRRVLAR
jgi:hypothetical protein